MLAMQMGPFWLSMPAGPDNPEIAIGRDFCWPTDTAECIALSALKWEFIAACCRAMQTPITRGIDDTTCALCHKFSGVPRTRSCNRDGELCPVVFVSHTNCSGTDYKKYISAETWVDAAQAADQFAAFLKNLKPVPMEPEFKGFCLGKSHDGFVGLILTDSPGPVGIILSADIPSPSHSLLNIRNDGIHLCPGISCGTPVSFQHLLTGNGTLKIC